MAKFILASSSKSRLSLLEKINIKPDLIIPADIDETPFKKEKPEEYVKRIAKTKAEKIHENNYGSIVLAADTIITRNAKIMQKAHNDDEVKKSLEFLSGKSFRVLTAVYMIKQDNTICKKLESTKIKFKILTKRDIDEYIKSKEGLEKAGALFIEGLCESFTVSINGSYSNIVGLPLHTVRNFLISAGL